MGKLIFLSLSTDLWVNVDDDKGWETKELALEISSIDLRRIHHPSH
jgi:hypothetical protein